jgi:hypothetical protein
MVWAISLSTMKFIPHSLTPRLRLMAFMVWLELTGYSPTESIQSPTTINDNLRLHLNAFRGERAISEFDWHFTSTHSSSNSSATLTGSGLHLETIEASPWPWVAHPASRLIPATKSPCSDSLSLRLRKLNCLTGHRD